MEKTQSTKQGSLVVTDFLLNLLALAGLSLIFYIGFVLLRGDPKLTPSWLQGLLPLFANNIFKMIFAVIWGVGSIALFFTISNGIVESLPLNIKQAIQPYVFVGPAFLILSYYLALPVFRTFWLSLHDRDGNSWVGLDNYIEAFTTDRMQIAFRNNLLWIIFGATLSVILGLIVATLADRSKFENIAKALIFLPMAISFVGAGVIWNFIYAARDTGDAQIGLLNAIIVALGGDPQAWTVIQPWNNFFLIIIVVWLQTGYAMVLFSSALKGIPEDQIEAARVDGANEWQIYFRIMIPSIMGTIITVSTTVVIFTLKIFDVVLVMTGGQYSTQVVATEFYQQAFKSRNFGLSSSIAIILLLAVIPVMIYNLREFRKNEAF